MAGGVAGHAGLFGAAWAGGGEVQNARASRRTPKEAWASMANLGEMGD